MWCTFFFTVHNFCFSPMLIFGRFLRRAQNEKKKTLKIALPCTSLKGHIITAHLNRFQSRKNTLIKMHKIRICRLKIFLLVKAQIHYKGNLLVGFHKLHTFRWHLVRVRSHCSYIHYWVNVINYLRNHCF